MLSSDDYEPLPSPHPGAMIVQTESVNCLGTLETLVLRFGLFAGMYMITRGFITVETCFMTELFLLVLRLIFN